MDHDGEMRGNVKEEVRGVIQLGSSQSGLACLEPRLKYIAVSELQDVGDWSGYSEAWICIFSRMSWPKNGRSTRRDSSASIQRAPFSCKWNIYGNRGLCHDRRKIGGR